MEAVCSSSSSVDEIAKETMSDKEFIDDSITDSEDNVLEIQREHHKNVKRIAKNLDEFSDSLSFQYTDIASLKQFILQML